MITEKGHTKGQPDSTDSEDERDNRRKKRKPTDISYGDGDPPSDPPDDPTSSDAGEDEGEAGGEEEERVSLLNRNVTMNRHPGQKRRNYKRNATRSS